MVPGMRDASPRCESAVCLALAYTKLHDVSVQKQAATGKCAAGRWPTWDMHLLIVALAGNVSSDTT